MLDAVAALAEFDPAPSGGAPRFARARGEVRVAVAAAPAPAGARLVGLRQAGSAKCFLPRTFGRCEAVLLNTAGGLTGGDRFAWTVEVGPGAAMSVATQAAERAYRALPGSEARVETRLGVGAGASLDWLPQETILYEGAALSRRIEADLAEDARLLAVEPVVLGRAAHGEVITRLRWRDAWRVRRGGRLVWADGVRVAGALAPLGGAAGLRGAGALATLALIAPGAEGALAGLRARLGALEGAEGAASAWPGVLTARVLARDGWALRRALAPALEFLRGGPLPRVWTI